MALRPVNDTEVLKGKAVLYLRYSSDNQDETSIQYQRRECMKLAEKYNLEVLREYVDEEKSGRGDCTHKRTDYLKMKDDILLKKPRPERILCYKIDRLGRNVQEIINCYEDCKAVGTTPITTEMDFNVTNGVMFIMILANNAENESNNISTRTADASYEKALKGYFLGGPVPVGYKAIEFDDPDTRKGRSHKLVIDEDKAPIVAELFNKYAYSNATTNDLCGWLNEDVKLSNSQGGKWIKQTLCNLLRKPVYKGTQVYCSKKKNYYANTYEERKVEIPDIIPAIVSKELWDLVQKKLDNNSRTPRNVKKADTPDDERFLLTNYLYCGHCGGTMSGSSSTKKMADGAHKKYRYYECVNKHSYNTCNKQNIDKDYLENYVVSSCLALIDDDNIENTSARILALYKKRYGEKIDDKIEKENKKLEKRFNVLSELLVDDEIIGIPELKAKYINEIKSIREKISENNEKLKKAETTTKYIPSLPDVKDWILRIKKSADTIEGKQQIIRAFVKAVYVTDEHIIIIYNLDDTPDPDFTTFEKILSENNLEKTNRYGPKKRKATTKNSVSGQDCGAI